MLQHEMKEKWENPPGVNALEEVDSGSVKFDLTSPTRQRAGEVEGDAAVYP